LPAVHTRRLARLALVVVLAAGSAGVLGACSSGATAGNGTMNPPSTTKS
jgi:hypothetical protein